jgi:hypothetical protein
MRLPVSVFFHYGLLCLLAPSVFSVPEPSSRPLSASPHQRLARSYEPTLLARVQTSTSLDLYCHVFCRSATTLYPVGPAVTKTDFVHAQQAALDGAGFTNRFATDKARQGTFVAQLPPTPESPGRIPCLAASSIFPCLLAATMPWIPRSYGRYVCVTQASCVWAAHAARGPVS